MTKQVQSEACSRRHRGHHRHHRHYQSSCTPPSPSPQLPLPVVTHVASPRKQFRIPLACRPTPGRRSRSPADTARGRQSWRRRVSVGQEKNKHRVRADHVLKKVSFKASPTCGPQQEATFKKILPSKRPNTSTARFEYPITLGGLLPLHRTAT